MNSLGVIGLIILGLSTAWSQETKPLYQNGFENSTLDSLPDEFVVIDGAFAVKEAEGNKFLQLPGAPLDSYGFFFGPAEKGDLSASARVYGMARGRRFPTFALGLYGPSGYRVQVSPGKKKLELYRGDVIKTSVPYDWHSGKWTHLQITVRQSGAVWKIQGKAWAEGESEPTAPLITAEDPQPMPAGRASIAASPFAGTPIRFDDLAVARAPVK